MTSRQAVHEALDALPQQIWLAYLQAIRGMNLVISHIAVDDPTPLDALEIAIKAELDG